jgi:hypothetical protein
VRDFTAVIQISTLPVFNTRQDLAFGSAIGSKFIRHDNPRHVAQTFKQLSEEALGSLCIPAALNQHIEHVAMLVNGSPEVVQFASDAHEHLASRAGESHPRALPEPYVTLSRHTAPDVRPFPCRKRQCANRCGLARITRASHSLAPLGRRRNRLNLLQAQRSRKASMRCKVQVSADL